MDTSNNMTEKKLKIDLSPLWNDNSEKFTIRFLDINEKEKRILAQRIKDVARQARVRNTRGPNTQIIYETLIELNPIIFGEYHQRNAYRQVQGYRTFNINCTRAMNGYWFHQLCQAIYMLDCLKRNLTKKEISDIAYLTCQDWDRVQQFINDNFRGQDPEETERRVILGDIGMDDIAEARRRADENGADRIPDGVFEEEHTEIDEAIRSIGRGILNEVMRDGEEPELRTTTRPIIEERRRDPDIHRIEREIQNLERMQNDYPPGSAEWIRREEEKIERINMLRHEIDQLERQIDRRNRGQELPRNYYAMDRGGAEDFRVDIRVPTDALPREWHADYGTERIRGIRPTIIGLDEASHNENDENSI